MGFNDAIIDKFHARGGDVGEYWEGKTLVLLHTHGRKSGKEFVNPLVAAPDGDARVVCGTAGGAPEDPQWVANLAAADGPVTVEIGTETKQADATVSRAGDPEWQRLYTIWRDYWPATADYETKTDRKFPVARLVFHS